MESIHIHPHPILSIQLHHCEEGDTNRAMGKRPPGGHATINKENTSADSQTHHWSFYWCLKQCHGGGHSRLISKRSFCNLPSRHSRTSHIHRRDWQNGQQICGHIQATIHEHGKVGFSHFSTIGCGVSRVPGAILERKQQWLIHKL